MKAQFPRYLNAPLQFLWFEADDLAMILIAFMIASTYKLWFFWVLLVVAPWQYSRVKKKYPRGFLLHMLYFMGLTQFKGYPSAFENNFIE